MGKNRVILYCMVCGTEFIDEEPQMCCSGRECGCMGMPTEPVVCSDKCYCTVMKIPFGKGYHTRHIDRGVFGEISKVREEFEEMVDAHEQGNPIMVLTEMSDMVGAIEAYAARYNITLADILKMKEATAKAFADGTRSDKK